MVNTEPARHIGWWRQPTLHFLVIGAVLFGLDSAREGHSLSGQTDSEPIIVSAEHIAELRAALSADGQVPTTDALDHQIQAFIDEEIMVREAKTLGLDRGDMIIRRRLIQKMSFVIDDMASANPPSVGEMEAWLKSNSERYSTPARLSLEHC